MFFGEKEIKKQQFARLNPGRETAVPYGYSITLFYRHTIV